MLFPEDDGSPDTSKEKHEYMQQIERIKNELAGFQPIETPKEDSSKETESIESDCEELTRSEYYWYRHPPDGKKILLNSLDLRHIKKNPGF